MQLIALSTAAVAQIVAPDMRIPMPDLSIFSPDGQVAKIKRSLRRRFPRLDIRLRRFDGRLVLSFERRFNDHFAVAWTERAIYGASVNDLSKIILTRAYGASP